jgi:hypothetical protein
MEMDGRFGVIGVVGGSGGVGASRFAAVLAAVAAARVGRSLLIDLDPGRGGLDVLVGVEALAGPRWAQLRLAGGRLDGELLLSGLPQWGQVAVLACDRFGLPPPEGVAQVIAAARTVGPVVVDLPRCASPARAVAVSAGDALVLVSAGDLSAVTGARSVLVGLAAPRSVLVIRCRRRAARAAAELIGLPLAARLPALGRRDTAALDPGSLPRVMRRVAGGLLTGLLDSPGPSPAGWVPELVLGPSS